MAVIFQIVMVVAIANLSLAVRNLDCDQQDVNDNDARFPAHLYDSDLHIDSSPQTIQDWLHDVNRAFGRGSFTVAVHGVIGAGKSRLIERICGMRRSTITGVSDHGGVTTETRVYDDLRSDDGMETIYVLDTPGFGEQAVISQTQRNHERQKMVLKGLDQAAALCRRQQEGQRNAPLKRVYFMVDCDRTRNMFPKTLQNNLQGLAMAYGNSFLADVIVFVISKCDLLASKYQKSDFIRFRTALQDLYRTVFQKDIPNQRIIFISPELTNKRSTTKGSMHNLVSDLVLAARSPFRFYSFPSVLPRSPRGFNSKCTQFIHKWGLDLPITIPNDNDSILLAGIVDQIIARRGSSRTYFDQTVKKLRERSEQLSKQASIELWCMLIPYVGVGTGIAGYVHKAQANEILDDVLALKKKWNDFDASVNAFLEQIYSFAA